MATGLVNQLHLAEVPLLFQPSRQSDPASTDKNLCNV